MENFKHVLVVDSMSEYSREAVQVGISIAKKYGADLRVLRILSGTTGTLSIAGGALNAPSAIPDDSKTWANAQQGAREELDKIIEREINGGLSIKVIVKDGKPLDEISLVVKEEKVDLMVLLAHEEGRLEHMVFGRDNDALLRRMPCSILLIKREPEPVDW